MYSTLLIKPWCTLIFFSSYAKKIFRKLKQPQQIQLNALSILPFVWFIVQTSRTSGPRGLPVNYYCRPHAYSTWKKMFFQCSQFCLKIFPKPVLKSPSRYTDWRAEILKYMTGEQPILLSHADLSSSKTIPCVLHVSRHFECRDMRFILRITSLVNSSLAHVNPVSGNSKKVLYTQYLFIRTRKFRTVLLDMSSFFEY